MGTPLAGRARMLSSGLALALLSSACAHTSGTSVPSLAGGGGTGGGGTDGGGTSGGGTDGGGGASPGALQSALNDAGDLSGGGVQTAGGAIGAAGDLVSNLSAPLPAPLGGVLDQAGALVTQSGGAIGALGDGVAGNGLLGGAQGGVQGGVGQLDGVLGGVAGVSTPVLAEGGGTPIGVTLLNNPAATGTLLDVNAQQNGVSTTLTPPTPPVVQQTTQQLAPLVSPLGGLLGN